MLTPTASMFGEEASRFSTEPEDLPWPALLGGQSGWLLASKAPSSLSTCGVLAAARDGRPHRPERRRCARAFRSFYGTILGKLRLAHLEVDPRMQGGPGREVDPEIGLSELDRERGWGDEVDRLRGLRQRDVTSALEEVRQAAQQGRIGETDLHARSFAPVLTGCGAAPDPRSGSLSSSHGWARTADTSGT
jgi:hypothetical protein